MAQLTNVVDLRASLHGPIDDHLAIKLPYLRFASLAVTVHIEQIMNCFDLPAIEGLNLWLTSNHSWDALGPVPTQLQGLRVLWLGAASRASISNPSLSGFLTGIPTLVDLGVSLYGFDTVIYLFTLLSPTCHSIVVPQLQVLRVSGSELFGEPFDVLLVMLRQRFGAEEAAGFVRLKRFEFFLRPRRSKKPSRMFAGLESLRVQHGWDIRVHENWVQEFWHREMDEEFL